MTRGLPVLIGPERSWMSTPAFLAKLDENLKAAMK
jgi:hypothetical protein